MRILVGSLGPLGFLVKDVTRDGATRDWSILPDTSSLSGRLSAVFPEGEIRAALRRLRSDGRVVLTCDDQKGRHLVAGISPAI